MYCYLDMRFVVITHSPIFYYLKNKQQKKTTFLNRNGGQHHKECYHLKREKGTDESGAQVIMWIIAVIDVVSAGD